MLPSTLCLSFLQVSRLDKWSFVGASAQFSANKNNIKINTFFGVIICLLGDLLRSVLVLLASFLVQLREIKTRSERSCSFHSYFARGECKPNSLCMSEEFSQITRSSRRFSVSNCPSIFGVFSFFWCVLWLSQRRAPLRDVELYVAELEELQTSAQRRGDLNKLCRAFRPSERQPLL